MSSIFFKKGRFRAKFYKKEENMRNLGMYFQIP